MFGFPQSSSKHKSILEFIYKMVNQIKALSMETNKELKMKYWDDRIKAKQGSSFPLLGRRNYTHKNNTMEPRVSNGITETSSRWKSKILF